MLEVIMPDIRRNWRKREWIMIPGGWKARVPEVQGEEQVVAAYTAYFLPDGIPPAEARRKAEACIQEPYTSAFMEGLKASTFGHAIKYATMWPELREVEEQFKTGNCILRLRGFKPELLQSAYVPGQRPGVDGLPFVKELLRNMGRNVKQEAT